jgi:dihydroorotate dehydrogenase (NAD+) catalytic subunit
MLRTEIAGIQLKNPVIAASGTIGLEAAALTDLEKLGAVIPKTITYEAKKGNPPPRTCETSAGMLNSIGLENKGVERFICEDLPEYLSAGATVIVSIGGETVDEYAMAADTLNEAEGIVGIEVNVSCPNVDKGGIQFGSRARQAAAVTEAVKYASRYPVIVKLTPNVTSVTEIAKACAYAGADAISLINTLLGMAIDINTSRPKLGRGYGGLSGPAIKPIALRMVYDTVAAVSIPVIGIGGIMDFNDALEFLMAGAAAIQVGTASFIEPDAGVRIVEDLETYVAGNGYDNISQLIGKAQL